MREFSVSQRAAVVCLVVVCQKAQPDWRTVDGDDPSIAGLLRDATPTSPAISHTPSDRAEPNPPTDQIADLAVGLPTLERHLPCPGDGIGSRA